jgi:hypothetical protein
LAIQQIEQQKSVAPMRPANRANSALNIVRHTAAQFMMSLTVQVRGKEARDTKFLEKDPVEN